MIAGPGGDVPTMGDLAILCSRSGGSRRPYVCGKSPKEFSFCRAHVVEGPATIPRQALPVVPLGQRVCGVPVCPHGPYLVHAQGGAYL
jgi:hypothetical protein